MQVQFYRLRARQQIDLRPAQRRRGRRLSRTDGCQHHELRRIPALPEARQDIHRRRVGPLEILDPQDQRAGVRERLQGRDHFTQHPRRRRDLRSRAREQRRVGIIHQRRQKRQPARRMPRERCRDRAVFCGSGKTRQQIDQRIVGLGRAHRLHALRPGRTHRVPPGSDAEEGLAQGGLADAGFAGDEDDLALSRGRGVEQLEKPIHLAVPADEDMRSGRRLLARRVDDRSDEDVAALHEAADEAGADRIVAEGAANLADQHFDVVGVHVAVGPDRLEQCLLRDNVAGALDEDGEQLDGLVCERNLDVVPPERLVAWIERERCEILHSQLAIVTESHAGIDRSAGRGSKSYRNPTASTIDSDPTDLLPESNRGSHDLS